MLVLKYLFKFVRLLNSETAVASLAVALTLGMFIGVVPFFTLHVMCVFLVIVFFRVNLTATIVSAGLFKLAALAAQAHLHRAGAALLEDAQFLHIWMYLYNAPVVSYCMLNNSVVLASTIAALVLLLPTYAVAAIAVKVYRAHIQHAVAGSRLVSGFKTFKLYTLYRRLSTPFG